MSRSSTPSSRNWHYRDFPLETLAEAKADADEYVSVCLPTRDEAATVGEIVSTIRQDLVDTWQVVDEVLVVDDGSTDATRRVAADAGARVVAAADVLGEMGPASGKGEALWKSLHAAKGSILVFCDADVRDFPSHFVSGLLGPLLVDPGTAFVKGYYDRPVNDFGEGGGRVTELVARPLINLLFPHLEAIVQPLAGEFAARREVLEQLPFVQGYGVDLALVIDVAARFGVPALAQVDLGTRAHRNRPLEELSPQALAVTHAALARAGIPLSGDTIPKTIPVGERPPIVEVTAYRRER